MYKNRANNGRNNVVGLKIKELRNSLKDNVSQRELSVMFQTAGLDVDKNAVQRMESGKRFITDIELRIIALVFDISLDELLS